MERLRENECPKLVKRLCKHDNEEIAKISGQIIKKWTKIITATTDKGTGSQNGGSGSSNTTANAKEKKRKADSGSSESSKKQKSSGIAASAKATTNAESDNGPDKADNNSNASSESSSNHATPGSTNDDLNYESFSRNDMNKFIIKKDEPKHRPTTAKVKQGKFRLDLSAPSSTAPAVKTKKKVGDAKDPKEVKKPLPLSKATTGNGTLKAPKTTFTTSTTLATSIQVSDHAVHNPISFNLMTLLAFNFFPIDY